MKLNTSKILLACAVLLVPAMLVAQDGEPVQIPLSLSGLSVSQAYQVEDGQPLDFENETLLRLLYRIAKVSQKSLDKFSEYSDDVSIAQIPEDSRKYRFWVFKLTGRVTNLKIHTFAGVGPDSSLQSCYIVDIEHPDGEKIQVLARSVPKAWIDYSPLDQIASTTGFYFGTVVQTDRDDDLPKPMFVADRMDWYPDGVNEEMGVGPAQVLLARHGFDLGLLDQVRKQNTRTMGTADSKPFFQMLGASRRISTNELELPASSADFVGLMQNPLEHFADVVTVQGRVKRCVPVEIDDKDIAKRLGFDRYYELDMFIVLGDQRIVVKAGPETSLEYRHRFPITVCIADLGQSTTPEDVENRMIEVTGFFYRFWKYKSEFTDQKVGADGQVSPLIIGVSPLVISEAGLGLDRVLSFVILVLLLGGFAFFWVMRSSSGKPASVKGSPLNQPLPDRPDFSGISAESE